MGYSWPGVFLLGASGRTGRFFTQLLFHNPRSAYRYSEAVVSYLFSLIDSWQTACIGFIGIPKGIFEF